MTMVFGSDGARRPFSTQAEAAQWLATQEVPRANDVLEPAGEQFMTLVDLVKAVKESGSLGPVRTTKQSVFLVWTTGQLEVFRDPIQAAEAYLERDPDRVKPMVEVDEAFWALVDVLRTTQQTARGLQDSLRGFDNISFFCRQA